MSHHRNPSRTTQTFQKEHHDPKRLHFFVGRGFWVIPPIRASCHRCFFFLGIGHIGITAPNDRCKVDLFIRLMAEILHQSRLVVYPIIYYKVWCRISSINSITMLRSTLRFFYCTENLKFSHKKRDVWRAKSASFPW